VLNLRLNPIITLLQMDLINIELDRLTLLRQDMTTVQERSQKLRVSKLSPPQPWKNFVSCAVIMPFSYIPCFKYWSFFLNLFQYTNHPIPSLIIIILYTWIKPNCINHLPKFTTFWKSFTMDV